MSENTETPTETVTEPADNAPEAPDTGERDWQAEADKWKALARKHEQNAKANGEKARRLDELEEASKSEAQKLAERVEAAEKRAAELESRALRAEVAATKGVPADLLTGSTEEELAASADRLLAFRGELPKVPSADGLGNVGKPVGQGDDIDAQIAAANKAGDWRLALSLNNEKLARIAPRD